MVGQALAGPEASRLDLALAGPEAFPLRQASRLDLALADQVDPGAGCPALADPGAGGPALADPEAGGQTHQVIRVLIRILARGTNGGRRQSRVANGHIDAMRSPTRPTHGFYKTSVGSIMWHQREEGQSTCVKANASRTPITRHDPELWRVFSSLMHVLIIIVLRTRTVHHY